MEGAGALALTELEVSDRIPLDTSPSLTIFVGPSDWVDRPKKITREP